MDDADALATVHVRGWQAAYRGLMPQEHLDALDPVARVPGWRQWILGADGMLVLEDAGRPIGFINVMPSRDSDTEPLRVGEVTAFYLLPEFWGRGGGRLLMQAGLRHLEEAAFREAILWVLATNTRARRFYAAAGWQADGAAKTDDSLGFPLAEVRYRRALRDR